MGVIRKNIIACFILFLATVGSVSYSQTQSRKINRILAKSNAKFEEEGKYLEARRIYLDLLKDNPRSPEINFALGINYHYYSTDKKEIALEYLRNALKNSKGDSVPDYIYYLAESEQFNENYENAIPLYKNLLGRMEGSQKEYLITPSAINQKVEECRLAIAQRDYGSSDVLGHFSNPINTEVAEYTPVFFENSDKLFYTARRILNIGAKKDELDDKYFEDIYFATDSVGTKNTNTFNTEGVLSKITNTKFHDAITWKSQNDSVLIFYRKNLLYITKLTNGSYSNPMQLFKNNEEGNVWRPHASIDLKTNTIFFSKNKDAEHDNLDIYKGKLEKDGTVNNVENLGGIINSDLDEDSPNYDERTHQLFFSSKKNTVGGYDIFAAQLDSLNNVVDIKTLGYPYNSPGDDVFYINDNKNHSSYFSSFRKGGKGDMDLYKIYLAEKPCRPYLNQKIELALNAIQFIDSVVSTNIIYAWDFGDDTKDTGMIVNHIYKRPSKYVVTLNAVNRVTGKVESEKKEFDMTNVNYFAITSYDTVLVGTTTPLSGKRCTLKNDTVSAYQWDTGDGKTLQGDSVNYTYAKTGVYCQNLAIKTTKNRVYNTGKQIVVVDSLTTPIIASATGQQTVVTLDFENNTSGSATTSDSLNSIAIAAVFFDFDKSFIRKNDFEVLDHIIDVFKANPHVYAEIAASCDSRGKMSYNFKLSSKRAKSVYRYFISKGLDKKRIKGLVNLGESKLYNHCKDGKKCSALEHQQNRRATIRLIQEK